MLGSLRITPAMYLILAALFAVAMAAVAVTLAVHGHAAGTGAIYGDHPVPATFYHG